MIKKSNFQIFKLINNIKLNMININSYQLIKSQNVSIFRSIIIKFYNKEF